MAAKRTHSRRSCELCKRRKSRCELPDQWVTSSTEPQPLDKSCHRCIVLAVPCIVDDTGRRRGLPDRPQRRSRAKPRHSNENKVDNTASSSTAVHLDDQHVHDGRAQVLHDFRPRLSGVNAPEAASSNDLHQVMTMELHGRPLRLACAMLGAAYGSKEDATQRLLRLCTADLVTRLDPGVVQLRIFHPHLPTLTQLVDDCTARPCTSLLLATALYLGTGSVPYSQDTMLLRSELVPLLESLRTEAIMQYPMPHAAAQAFEVLSLHSPLGVLPWETADFTKLSLTRGQVEIPLNGLDITRLFAPTPSQRMELWNEDHSWIWLGHMASQAKLALEDEDVYMPPLLETAATLVQGYLQSDSAELWTSSDDHAVAASIIGKLGICDRITRLWLIHASLEKLRRLLDTLVHNPFFDIYPPVQEEVHGTIQQCADLDARHEGLLAQITSSESAHLQDTWLAYRSIRKTFDLNRLDLYTLRVVMSTAYIPGTALSRDGLPQDVPPDQRVKFAMDKLKTASNITALFPDHPAAMNLEQWGIARREWCEGLLASVAELPKLYDQLEGRVPILPIIEISTLALESAKVFLEMRGGEVTSGRVKTNSRFRLPLWFVLMREASAALARVGNGGTAEEKGSTTVATGCANLILAMERLMEGWSQALKDDRSHPSSSEITPSALASGSTLDDLSMSAVFSQDTIQQYLGDSVQGANLLGSFAMPQGSTGVFDDPFSAGRGASQISPSTAFIAQLFDLPIPTGHA